MFLRWSFVSTGALARDALGVTSLPNAVVETSPHRETPDGCLHISRILERTSEPERSHFTSDADLSVNTACNGCLGQ